MNAKEFIKQYGWERAKEHLQKMDAENWHNEFFKDLKQHVDAWELVMEFGDDVIYLKKYLLKNPEIKEIYFSDWCQTFTRCQLKKAIELVESVNE